MPSRNSFRSPAARSAGILLSIIGDINDSLVNVQPDTFIRWHRKGFRLLWRWKSRPVGRPRIPNELLRLIQEMAAENPTWGEERIANELNQVGPGSVQRAPTHSACRLPSCEEICTRRLAS
jgi:hypothetical protein